MPRYPHLSESGEFPNLGTVRPYRRKVDFDYDRYDYTASIKLCMVPWDAGFANVVNWASEAARDAWFDALDGYSVELANGFTHVQTDHVTVNVPYDVALRYNYVVLRVPQLTQGEPIHHEGTPHLRTICAFIGDAAYLAPSSTDLILEVDWWTTYLPHLSVNALMLERGHAPMYATDAETYLANPRAHAADLLTPDVNFGTPEVAAHSELVNIANGQKLLVFESTVPYADAGTLTQSQATGGMTAPSYYDTGTRNGHQVGVSGYEWDYNERSYANMRQPLEYSAQGDGMPSYTWLYALDAPNAAGALATLAITVPQFIASVQACYVLPKSALTLGAETLSVGGVALYTVVPQVGFSKITDLTLAKSQFGYDARYADIAKLYTFPYARLVVSDTFGQDVEVRIENMGASAALMRQLSPMAECLRWDVLVSDANSAGVNAYTWTKLDGQAQSMSLDGADVARYTLELGVPTYALYLDGRTAHALTDWYTAQSERASAVNGYQATMRSANTGLENAEDSNATAKTNADASADVNVTNTANSGRNNQANTTASNNLRTAKTARNNVAQNALTADALANIYDSSNADLEYTEFATDINLKSEAVSSIQNLVANAIAGNPMGVLGAGVSGIVNITTSGALAQLSETNVLDHQTISQGHTQTANNLHIANATDQTTLDNDNATLTTNNNVATQNTNATNSANTAKANATRTRTTGDANAGYTRATSEENAKAALELAQANYARRGHTHDLDAPVAYGSVSGDPSPDALMRRVVQVRIDTQAPSAIARAGDAFLRYGYRYDGMWQVGSWCPTGRDYCYWQARDICAPADALGNPTAVRAFGTMLANGVTVWNDPSKIGRAWL